MRIKQKRERPGRPYKACTVASNCAQKRTHTEAKTTGPPPRAAPPADSIRGLLAAANEATGTKPFALGATDTPFYRRDGGKGRWLKTCPFCGGDPSPVDCSNDARSPSPVDCSNDAAIALALSRSWA